ncbi:hypothetical protein PAXRUDRAFT_21608, partial [Paxillus rubicundulus Ve08.2h10]
MDPIPILIGGPTRGFDIIEPDRHPSTPGNPNPKCLQQLLRPLHLAKEGLHEKAPEGYPRWGMPPLSPGKGGLQSIPASKATPGAVEGSSPSPGPSKGSIPRPFQRPNSSIRSGDFEATSYPLERGPKLWTWPFPIKEGQGLSLQIEAKDAFDRPKGKIHDPSSSIKVYHPLAGPPPRSIPRASALELIATPVNPILDPRPGPSSDPIDQIIKGLEVRVANLEKQVERIPDLELQLSSMAWVVEALREQVTGPTSL